MSKPSWSWQWMSLKFWIPGRRQRGNSRRHRPLRMETLVPRHLLATDLFVGPLPPVDATALADTYEPAAQPTDSVTATIDQSQPAEGEAAAARNASAASFRYDVNGDGKVSPIDVLLVIKREH